MSKRDYYAVLGLAKNASDDDIKKAYRKMASKYHPDKVTDEAKKKVVEEKFKEAKEAYETLSDASKRSHYDNVGHHSGDYFRHRSFNTQNDGWDELRNIFEKNFTNSDTFHSTPRATTFVVNISLTHAYTGKIVAIDSQTTINIPAGIRSGTKLFVNNKLYQINVQLDSKFKRSDDDLLVDVEVGAIEAMLGVSAVLEHLDGSKLQFSVPPGIQPGQIIRLAGKGMKNPELSKVGDLMIRISVNIPKNLSNTETEILKSIAHRKTISI